MLSNDAIESILGIEKDIDLTPEKMLSKLTFTFFPYDRKKCSRDVLQFSDQLQSTLQELGVKVIPYNETLETISYKKVFIRFFRICLNNLLFVFSEIFHLSHTYYHIHPGALLNLLKRHRVRKGITIVALGENSVSSLPMDYTSSFTKNCVVTLLDFPSDINENVNFSKHFDAAMNMFSYHMTQIAIIVNSKNFIVYNFNASHPVYPLNRNFKENILRNLIPKIAAPIKPPLLKEFIIETESFNINSAEYKNVIDDLVEGGKLFDKTNLYPPGKKVANLPFRSGFYRWIGRMHLDHRSGMSYGFLARQIRMSPEVLLPWSNNLDSSMVFNSGGYFIKDDKLHIFIELWGIKYYLRVPPVWVMTQRSGSNKTDIKLKEDILLIGLIDGKMYLRTPIGSKMRKDYKPSFDTRVILAHAVGNGIISSIQNHISKTNNKLAEFSKILSRNGLAIAHWHGYIQGQFVPNGWLVHGYDNPHVACSSPQSAVYALSGKLNSFNEVINGDFVYKGDIHIEPHHGTNITYTSLKDLASFLLNNPNASELGNKYLVEQK